jgi:hypothetical protein
MELAIAAACFGITIVGLYTLAIHRQLYKLSDEFGDFKSKVQKGFTDVHKDIDMVDKTMRNPKQQLNG